MTETKIKGSELSNKIDNFKKQGDDSFQRTNLLKAVTLTYPELIFNTSDFLKVVNKIGDVYYTSSKSFYKTTDMTKKKLCFFGDTNKIMIFDIES